MLRAPASLLPLNLTVSQLTSSGGTRLTFDYNHAFRVTGITTVYIYDPWGNLIATADGLGNITAKYIYGKGLIAMAAPSGRYCYHFNGTASTIAITDMNQNIVNSYAYDPFGQILAQQETIPQPFKYVGQYGVMAEPNGLYYMRARYYDPTVGRFISEDPLGFGGGDVNLYAYVMGNPITFIDPLGLEVGEPGTLESFIPIWGSGRQAINDFQTGSYAWGTVNTAVAISDVFLVKSLATGVGKGLWKCGSHTWPATRKWLLKIGWVEPWQPAHHWAIPQSGWGEYIPDFIKNQPLNLMPMENRALHDAVHGVGPSPFNAIEQFLYGTPGWFKALLVSGFGRVADDL